MKRKHILYSVLAIGISIAAYAMDYGRELLRDDFAAGFQPASSVLYMLVTNLIFTGLVFLVFAKIKTRDASSIFKACIIVLGIILITFPVFIFRSSIVNDFLMPYITMRVTYASLTGSLWIVLGVLGLFGRKKDQGSNT
jgi:hypothetical protein